MSAFSDVTSGRTSSESPVTNGTSAHMGSDPADSAATVVVNSENPNSDTKTNGENIEVEGNGVKFCGTDVEVKTSDGSGLSPEEKSKIDTIKAELNELKAQEMKAATAEALAKLCCQIFLSGGLSFSAMINLPSKFDFGDKFDKLYESRLDEAEKAQYEDNLMNKYEGRADTHEDLAQLKENLRDDISNDKYDMKITTIYMEHKDDENYQWKGDLAEPDIFARAQENVEEFGFSSVDDVKVFYEEKITDENLLMKEYDYMDRIISAQENFGDMSKEERTERYNELKEESDALRKMKNDDIPLTRNQESHYKNVRDEMNQIKIIDRQESLDNLRNDNLSADDFTHGSHSTNDSHSGFDFFNNHNNNNFNNFANNGANM